MFKICYSPDEGGEVNEKFKILEASIRYRMQSPVILGLWTPINIYLRLEPLSDLLWQLVDDEQEI